MRPPSPPLAATISHVPPLVADALPGGLRSMELSTVRCQKPDAQQPVQLEHMFLNGRYVRYIHIPDGVDIVQAVHNRTKKQGKAQLSHRRTSEVIRESLARRERMRIAQENAVRAASGEELIPTVSRRLGAAPDERAASSALEYMDTSGSRLLQSLIDQRTAGQQQPSSDEVSPASSQTEKFRQAREKANTLGFVDKMMPACRDCKVEFTWTAAEQAFYHEKGFENEPQRCKGCLKDKKEREGGSGRAQRGGRAER